MNELQSRELMVARGRSLYDRGYAHGSSGNLSMRVGEDILITPTGTSLGRLEPERLSRLRLDGSLVKGDAASKEAFLHLAIYAERPDAQAIVHLHCSCAVAWSCMVHSDPRNVLPPLTAYHVMRVGTLPLIPYFRPGDLELAHAVRQQARKHRAMLLANHGPVIAGNSLDDALDRAEELEATARVALLVGERPVSLLTAPQIAELEARFPN